MSKAPDYEKQNFALIHWQGREGIIHRLGHKTSSSFGPLTHSIAQALAMVHDLRLESLQFRFYRGEFDHHTILPNDVQLVFFASDNSSFLGISAFVSSLRGLGNEPQTLLAEVGESLDGILKRKQSKGYTPLTLEEIETSLLGFYEGELFGDWDSIQDAKLQNYATRQTRQSPAYWNKEFQLIGFFDFPGTYPQNVRHCNGNHEWDSDKSDGCPICGSLNYEDRPPSLAIPFLNFFRGAESPLLPSEMLRYVVEWPRLGTFVVRTLVQEEKVWGPGFIKVLLLPNQMVFRTQENRYVATLWRFAKETGLKVAVLQSAEKGSQYNPRRLFHYQHYLGKMKWDSERLIDALQLEQIVSNEQVGFADKGDLTRVNASLVEHLDGLVESSKMQSSFL